MLGPDRALAENLEKDGLAVCTTHGMSMHKEDEYVKKPENLDYNLVILLQTLHKYS
jgi:hypothetical protein